MCWNHCFYCVECISPRVCLSRRRSRIRENPSKNCARQYNATNSKKHEKWAPKVSQHPLKIHQKIDTKTMMFFGWFLEFILGSLRLPKRYPSGDILKRTPPRTTPNCKKGEVRRWSAKVMCGASCRTPTRPRRGGWTPGPERISVACGNIPAPGLGEVGCIWKGMRIR